MHLNSKKHVQFWRNKKRRRVMEEQENAYICAHFRGEFVFIKNLREIFRTKMHKHAFLAGHAKIIC